MNQIFNRISQLVSTEEAARKYGINVRDHMSPCPFHHETHPSLKYYPGSRGFYCFGCHAHGDVVDFTSRLFNLSPFQAAAKLNMDFSLGVLDRKETTSERAERIKAEQTRKRKQEQRKNELEQLNDKYREHCRERFLLMSLIDALHPDGDWEVLALRSDLQTEYELNEMELDDLFEEICSKERSYIYERQRLEQSGCSQ